MSVKVGDSMIKKYLNLRVYIFWAVIIQLLLKTKNIFIGIQFIIAIILGLITSIIVNSLKEKRYKFDDKKVNTEYDFNVYVFFFWKMIMVIVADKNIISPVMQSAIALGLEIVTCLIINFVKKHRKI